MSLFSSRRSVASLAFSCLVAASAFFPAVSRAGIAPVAAIPWSDNSRPCWNEAARHHGVNPWLLYAIAGVESGYNPNAINRANRNGTVDIGLMQINSAHLATLRRHGIPASALYNACASTYVAAWVLANNQRRYGNTWQAIAAYNVGSLNTPGRYRTGLNYARKVYKIYGQVAQR